MGFSTIQLIYYLAALGVMVWMMWRYRQSLFLLLLLLLAFNGPLSYFLPSGPQMMRVVTTVLATVLLWKHQVFRYWDNIKELVVLFALLSVYFLWTSVFTWGDKLLFVFGQYSKLYVPFACYLIFNVWMRKSPKSLDVVNNMFKELIYIQVATAVVKAVLLRFSFYEGMVGTFGQPQVVAQEPVSRLWR